MRYVDNVLFDADEKTSIQICHSNQSIKNNVTLCIEHVCIDY